jgi:hypothetical protein
MRILVILLSTFLFSKSNCEIQNTCSIFGIMVTRSSHWFIKTWLAVHAYQFSRLAILDGTSKTKHRNFIASVVRQYPNIIYLNENDLNQTDPKFIQLSHKTDNGLRNIAWSLLNLSDVLNHWVVIAHPDEFYPVQFCDLARNFESQGANAGGFTISLALPIIEDKMLLNNSINNGPKSFNIMKQISYCDADYSYLEHRMFKYNDINIRWGMDKHGWVLPEYFPKMKFSKNNGHYIHYKVHNFDVDSIDPATGQFTYSTWKSATAKKVARGNNNQLKYDIFSLSSNLKMVHCSELINNYCSNLFNLQSMNCTNLQLFKWY